MICKHVRFPNAPPPRQMAREGGPHYSVLSPGMRSLRELLPGQFCTEETLPLLIKSMEQRKMNYVGLSVNPNPSLSPSLASHWGILKEAASPQTPSLALWVPVL